MEPNEQRGLVPSRCPTCGLPFTGRDCCGNPAEPPYPRILRNHGTPLDREAMKRRREQQVGAWCLVALIVMLAVWLVVWG